jgi:putative ABC transport system permease protein
MDKLLHEIRYAFRQFRESPGFCATAVLTLALGIAATTATFSVVEGVLLRPLPFHDPGRLVALGDLLEGTGFGTGSGPPVTAPEIANTHETRTPSMASVATRLLATSIRAQVNPHRSMRHA